MSSPFLTFGTAEEIRRRYKSGEADQPTLAEEFGVTQHHISRIVNGHAHIGPPTLLVPLTAEQPGWWDDRGCRDVDVEIFYPLCDSEVWRAKAVCAACPVLQACLDHALRHREDFGVWGGATEHERRRMPRPSRRRVVAEHGTRSCAQAGCRRPECLAAEADYKRRLRAVGA